MNDYVTFSVGENTLMSTVYSQFNFKKKKKKKEIRVICHFCVGNELKNIRVRKTTQTRGARPAIDLLR